MGSWNEKLGKKGKKKKLLNYLRWFHLFIEQFKSCFATSKWTYRRSFTNINMNYLKALFLSERVRPTNTLSIIPKAAAILSNKRLFSLSKMMVHTPDLIHLIIWENCSPYSLQFFFALLLKYIHLIICKNWPYSYSGKVVVGK